MIRDPLVYIEDILEAIDRATDYIADLSPEELRQDRKTFDAVVRNIEIIGEAAKQIPQFIIEKYPDLPWSEAAKMRDVMIHDYPDILVDVVWTTTRDDLPIFKRGLLKVKEDCEHSHNDDVSNGDAPNVS